ncbi:citrate/2-methylcitrate synthase [Virgibacillus chiguensis]
MSTDLADVAVAKTKLCFIDGDEGLLEYRGHEVGKLAKNHVFEEVVHLLLMGHLPSVEELSSFKNKMALYRSLPEPVKEIINTIPTDVDMLSVLRTAISTLGEFSFPPTVEQSLSICTKIPSIIAYRYNRVCKRKPVEPSNHLGHTANYLYMIKGTEPKLEQVQALEAYLISTLEHGMNPSTFTARVITSTRADIVSSVSAAISALKGPLHGGALSQISMNLQEIGSKENTERWLREKIEAGKRIMGFGHRVYKYRDPRVLPLKNIAIKLSGNDSKLDLATHVEEMTLQLLKEYKPNKQFITNVEFYAAALLNAVGFDNNLLTATFAVSRSVGWCAHSIEAANGPLIYPQSVYSGPRIGLRL